MKLKLEEKIEEKINSKINELGFEIEYIEFAKEDSNTILRIVLDKLNDVVTIEDCETVSRAVEEDIDIMVEFKYILEVSSPGLERQLKNLKLYKKYINSEIYIKLYKKGEFGKELVGVLESVDEENLSINMKILKDKVENIAKIDIKEIATAHTTFDFDEHLKNNDKINLNKLGKF